MIFTIPSSKYSFKYIFKQLSQICSFVIDFGTAITADEGHLPAKPGETRLQLPGVEEEGWREPDY